MSGISDLIHVYCKYSLDFHKKHILFDFKIINMCPYTIDDVNVDFEGSLSMVPKPFPETSKCFYIKQLSTR